MKLPTSLKTGLKYLCPPVYQRLLFKRFLARLPLPYRATSGLSLIMGDRQAGFFSLVFQVLGAVAFCRMQGHNLRLKFDQGYYYDSDLGGSWWDYYFDTSNFLFSDNDSSPIWVSESSALGQFTYLGRDFHPLSANKILSCFGVKDHIREKVTCYYQRNFQDREVIGLHYRGTDKVEGQGQEAIRVPYEYIYDSVLPHCKRAFIFVATDEAGFLEYMNKRFAGRILSYDAIRSFNGEPIHTTSQSRSLAYRAGEEALIDCLLLSKCKLLLRTDSNLSLASTYFSPQLNTINLSEKYMSENKIYVGSNGNS